MFIIPLPISLYNVNVFLIIMLFILDTHISSLANNEIVFSLCINIFYIHKSVLLAHGPWSLIVFNNRAIGHLFFQFPLYSLHAMYY